MYRGEDGGTCCPLAPAEVVVAIPPLIGCYRRLPFHLQNLLESREEETTKHKRLFQRIYDKVQIISTGRHAVGLVGA